MIRRKIGILKLMILLIQFVKKTACSIQYNEVISVIFPAKNMQGQV